jgi:peptide/nickel transport system substrate-binding protein
LTAGALAATSTSLLAGKADDTLNVGFRLQLQSLDALYSPGREGLLLYFWVFDNILYRDPVTFEFKPLLAKAWTQVDDRTIDLTIREGVKFHDGVILTPDDVVFTLNFVANRANNVFNSSIFEWIDHAEKLPDGKVRVIAKGPTPTNLEYLSKIPVYPQKYYERVGKEGMGAEPVGTGPYRARRGPNNTVVFTRFEDYFPESPKGKAYIKTVVYKTVPEVNTQIAELITGSLNWAYYIPEDQAAKLRGMRNLKVVNADSLRIAFISMDAIGRADPNSPLKNKKVREAISHAIDRNALAKSLMGGSSRALESVCYPTQFGCTDDVRRFPYDVAKAKTLLKEAGYPDGFEIDVLASRSRPVADAVVGYLAAIGIKGRLQFLQYPAVVEKRRSNQAALVIDDWGSSSINDASAMLDSFFRGGPDDYTKDPIIIQALDRASKTLNAEARRDAFKEALQRIASEAYWLPLFTMPINYVMSADLDMPVSPDEVPEFYRAKWK